MNNRGLRRDINYRKVLHRMKKFWNTYESYRKYKKDGKWLIASSLNEAIKKFKDSNGKDFEWIIRAKEHHSNSPRRGDKWDKFYYKKLFQQEKELAKKQLKKDIQDASIWFEYRCSSCDRFPGNLDESDNENSEMICPYKHLFENGTYNADTIWKDFDCKYFYD